MPTHGVGDPGQTVNLVSYDFGSSSLSGGTTGKLSSGIGAATSLEN